MKTIYGRVGIDGEEVFPDEPNQEILFWQDEVLGVRRSPHCVLTKRLSP
jgi:hypothetical protein